MPAASSVYLVLQGTPNLDADGVESMSVQLPDPPEGVTMFLIETVAVSAAYPTAALGGAAPRFRLELSFGGFFDFYGTLVTESYYVCVQQVRIAVPLFSSMSIQTRQLGVGGVVLAGGQFSTVMTVAGRWI